MTPDRACFICGHVGGLLIPAQQYRDGLYEPREGKVCPACLIMHSGIKFEGALRV